MPVYQLIDEYIFPDPALCEPDGLLAIGGDLSKGRLIEAYSKGIFPWYSEGNLLCGGHLIQGWFCFQKIS